MLAHTPMAGSSRKDCPGRICLTKQGGGAIVAAFLQVVRPAVAVGEAAPELTLNNTMLRQRHRRQCFHKSLSLTQSGQLTQTIGDTTYWMPYGTANQDFWDAGCVRTLTPACYVFLSCESLIPEAGSRSSRMNSLQGLCYCHVCSGEQLICRNANQSLYQCECRLLVQQSIFDANHTRSSSTGGRLDMAPDNSSSNQL